MHLIKILFQPFYPVKTCAKRGFTLIEVSIVLVIIGLIVGGVLVGRDLISAAAVRSQIAQIEKLQTAVNTFKGKYNYMPGDIPDPDATRFGFTPRGVYAGTGNGDGVIEGNATNAAIVSGSVGGSVDSAGETAVFWVDLSTAKLLDGNFTKASAVNTSAWAGDIGGCCARLEDLLPQAKLGQSNYIYVWSGLCCGPINPTNHFGISKVSLVLVSGPLFSAPGITVQQAYNIDKKLDDGLPMTGRVIAEYVNTVPVWSPPYPASNYGVPDYVPALTASATSCFDNNNTGNTVNNYSITQNNGAGVNCGLSFKFQ